jgi:uncharacterized protein (DUF3084 family)
MTELTGYIIAAKTVVLVLGGLITLLARRAARRTGSGALRWFAVGFAIITVGALLGGALDWIAGLPLATVVLVESVLWAAGFGVLAHALYGSTEPTAEP